MAEAAVHHAIVNNSSTVDLMKLEGQSLVASHRVAMSVVRAGNHTATISATPCKSKVRLNHFIMPCGAGPCISFKSNMNRYKVRICNYDIHTLQVGRTGAQGYKAFLATVC
jgi:hypothetical protein